ncbi:MAG: HEPN domain-containing protein [Candidatus Margulisiibacteriota bacterium]
MSDQLESEYWLFYAEADLESAEVLLNSTENYHISIYHAHQAIEKMIKRYSILADTEFPFIHDLVKLYLNMKKDAKLEDDTLKELSYVMNLYSRTRYPKGDTLNKMEAEKALTIAKKYFTLLK